MSLEDIAIGVGLFALAEWAFRDRGGPTKPDVERMKEEIRTGYGGVDPLLMDRLAYSLKVRGLNPNLSNPSDPVTSMAEMIKCLLENPIERSTIPIPPTPAPPTRRDMMAAHLNLSHHRDILRGPSEPDGE